MGCRCLNINNKRNCHINMYKKYCHQRDTLDVAHNNCHCSFPYLSFYNLYIEWTSIPLFKAVCYVCIVPFIIHRRSRRHLKHQLVDTKILLKSKIPERKCNLKVAKDFANITSKRIFTDFQYLKLFLLLFNAFLHWRLYLWTPIEVIKKIVMFKRYSTFW